MNDFGPNDNDNQQYLVRLLLYSNEIDIEAIIPTTSEFQPDSIRTDYVFPIIDAYEQVQPVSLSAAGSSDPDGNQLQFQWIAYPEADYRVPLQALPQASVSGAGNQDATVTVDTPGVFHVILAVTDNGTPNLTSYRRVILNVMSPQ
jgi:hypothetical protein